MRLSDFDSYIVDEREDQVLGGGVVRRYRLPNGYGLNGINTPRARRQAYAWEFAVLEPDASHESGFGDVVFDTPLTGSVFLCITEADTVAFLQRALAWAGEQLKEGRSNPLCGDGAHCRAAFQD